jgi:ABC-type antimicrobial peptide transport system permease subunit
MEFSETLKLAFDSIWSHKLRSVLTLLGMIIGVTAVVIMVSLIQGFNRYVDEKIAGVGARQYSIRRFGFDDWRSTNSIAEAQRRNKELTFDDFDFLRERATLTDKLGAKAIGSSSQVKHGAEVMDAVSVDGATANCVDIDNLEIAEGRYFSATEDSSAANVAFIGADVASKLFPNSSPLDREIAIRGLPYRVVGVAVAKGTVFGMPQDIWITVPLKTYIKNFGPPVRQRSFYMVGTAKNDDRFADTVEEVRALLRSRRELKYSEKDNFGIGTPDAIMGMPFSVAHKLKPNAEDIMILAVAKQGSLKAALDQATDLMRIRRHVSFDKANNFGITTADSMIETFRSITFGVAVAMVAISSVGLMVGGIGVMNIMLVSVTERTREIGIRKAIGGRRRDIMWQFLIEAMTLTGMGGLIGLFIGWLLTLLIKLILPSYVPLWAPVVGFASSVGIGLVFGLWPAWKASRLDPIVALRYE